MRYPLAIIITIVGGIAVTVALAYATTCWRRLRGRPKNAAGSSAALTQPHTHARGSTGVQGSTQSAPNHGPASGVRPMAPILPTASYQASSAADMYTLPSTSHSAGNLDTNMPDAHHTTPSAQAPMIQLAPSDEARLQPQVRQVHSLVEEVPRS
ncbi:hypothetical protein OBBRIDRAFT_459015 [Obba rivulosa]|uniref:Transmembrane protein n=1 Tax=Obba rivulosa TaxID=1052685 RepID=A0A8E2ANS0_9APHY|nr:hypothetical protein OBBRIDRAFT_459015 [Obba rivulosa]